MRNRTGERLQGDEDAQGPSSRIAMVALCRPMSPWMSLRPKCTYAHGLEELRSGRGWEMEEGSYEIRFRWHFNTSVGVPWNHGDIMGICHVNITSPSEQRFSSAPMASGVSPQEMYGSTYHFMRRSFHADFFGRPEAVGDCLDEAMSKAVVKL